MAGKSTYLKQVAQLAIIAQIGCFIPATYASMPSKHLEKNLICSPGKKILKLLLAVKFCPNNHDDKISHRNFIRFSLL